MKPEKIQRFRALRAMANHPQTPATERDTALRMLEKMRINYPGIEQAADLAESIEQNQWNAGTGPNGWPGAGSRTGAAPEGEPGAGRAGTQRRRRKAPRAASAAPPSPEPSASTFGGDWRNKFASWMREFVSQVGQGLSISALAEKEVPVKVVERPQTIIVQAQISEHTLQRAAYLTNDDLSEFFRAVGDLVAQELIDRYVPEEDD